MSEQNVEQIYNEALNFALDEIDDADDAIQFLSMWREGDWEGIRDEYPSFDLSGVLSAHGIDKDNFLEGEN